VIELLVVALFALYLYARWSTFRSGRRQAAGFCARCGKAASSVKLGSDEFCEECATVTQRSYRSGSQFVAFLLVVLILPILLLSRGFIFESSFGREFLLVGAGLVLALVWIRRSLVRRPL
jgi:hypothetical protein